MQPIRFAVNLCQSTITAHKGNMPDDNEGWHIFYETESNLVRSLDAFVDPNIFRAFYAKLKEHYSLVLLLIFVFRQMIHSYVLLGMGKSGGKTAFGDRTNTHFNTQCFRHWNGVWALQSGMR